MSSYSRFIALRIARSRGWGFTRTIIGIAIAAVATSLVVMIVSLALISGFKKEISQKVFGFWGHINITDIRATDSYEALPIIMDTALMDTLRGIGGVMLDYGAMDARKKVTSIGGVRHVQAVAHIPAIITTKDEMEGIILKGVGEDYDWSMMQNFLVDGHIFDALDTSSASPVMISEYTSRRLQIKPGDRFILHFLKNDRQLQRRYTVSGIYKTGLEDYDKKYAFTPLAEVQQLLGWTPNQVGAIEIFVDEVDDAPLINEYIYLEELPAQLYSETIRQRFPNIFEWLDLQDINEVVILGLTLIVAIINMISALLILILERTSMIGILKALGSRNWGIQKIFLYHAAWIILQGLFLGNLLGLGLCWLQDKYKIITLDEADYYLSYAPVDVHLSHVLLLNAGTVLLTLLFLTLPSMLVMRIKPVAAIQFK
ncbi:MAG TPA: FtsX-like permease family protein [Saprospiraceae bacterium]|nr:FtsX-like permease family protein [Saprospiraceae bacterium]